MNFFVRLSFALLLCLAATKARAATPATPKPATRVKIALNWKPEPQFGGFYAVQVHKLDEALGLKLELIPGGSGTPVAQMLAAKKFDFGIVSADEIVVARDRKKNLKALFAVYQTNPQGIMVHSQRGFDSLADVFAAGGHLALQSGLPYAQFLFKKFPAAKVKVVPYLGGIASFLADSEFSQQCFVTAEPLMAQKAGAKPKTFLVADVGFNPYTTVLATRDEIITNQSALIGKVLEMVRMGWDKYLADPEATHREMHRLNPAMEMSTFAESAKSQIPLVRAANGRALGSMSKERWRELSKQLRDLGLIQLEESVDKLVHEAY